MRPGARENREMDLPAPAPLEPGDYYLEGSNLVFTAAYHLKRGTCCGSGCRHCPYGLAPEGAAPLAGDGEPAAGSAVGPVAAVSFTSKAKRGNAKLPAASSTTLS